MSLFASVPFIMHALVAELTAAARARSSEAEVAQLEEAQSRRAVGSMPPGWEALGIGLGTGLGIGLGMDPVGRIVANSVLVSMPAWTGGNLMGGLADNLLFNVLRGTGLVNTELFHCVVGAAVPSPVPAAVLRDRAHEAHDDYPSHWYVNFPHNMSAPDIAAVQHYRDSMTAFRSWTSKKWWEEVHRRYGNPDDPIAQARQSKQFAEIAFKDMVQMSWLRTTRPPNTMTYRLDCAPENLHSEIVSHVLGGWATASGDDVTRIVEPIFRDMGKASHPGIREYTDMKNIVMEKYVYDDSTKSITSYIRLLSFELREAFYEVARQGEEGGSYTRVSLDLSLCLYEAIFEAALWDKFSPDLGDGEADLLWKYVGGQTIHVPER